MVVVAPATHRGRDTVVALDSFAEAAGIRARKALVGFVSETRQQIDLLYDPE